MREGRFHPPKCRGKVQKIGEETLKGLFSRFHIPTAHLFGLMKSWLATAHARPAHTSPQNFKHP
jgi:hypothetical protein